jgi:glycine/D-amino acid oxidase-like deaminating enzyme
LLDCGEAVVDAERVLLCTNGFEDFSILAPDGLKLDKQFHKNVRGVVSYMSGYLVPMGNDPAGLVYLQGQGMTIEDYYYYLTRRPYEYDRGLGPRHDLVSVGGPQVLIEDHTAYSFQDGYPEERSAEIQGFLDRTFGAKSPKESERTFAWHGLMGYTRDMVRVVGAEPSHPALMYNLGCNGIGILPSIFGGSRIAAILAGDDLLPSVFDPRE